MPTLSRADNSLLGRWWWSVDRWTLGAIGMLIGFGYIMMLAASPAGRRTHRHVARHVHPQAGGLPGRSPAAIVVGGVAAVAARHQAAGHRRLHHRAWR